MSYIRRLFRPIAPAAWVTLGLTQPALALAARLGLSTIVDFEKSRRSVSREAVQTIRAAFERAGVEFIDENGGGPGVRLSKRQLAKRPK